MSIVIVSGSAGLVGSESVRFFAAEGFDVVGIDNDMRRHFFGDDASTAWCRRQLEAEVKGYRHSELDIRNVEGIDALFGKYGRAVSAVIHAAAQPSHDWAARDPQTDFTVNANGTLNLLQATKRHCPDAVFIFTSTNKVYGDRPNALPLIERPTRWEVSPEHRFAEHGIDESMNIDGCLHSLFGASKVAADMLVQEFGRYFGLNTACFRGGCLTGPGHAGAKLHGFLSYLARCAAAGTPYTVLGYKGKQVRDNIHSFDLVNAFWHFFRKPSPGAIYNIGGSRHSNCSMLEAILVCERLTGRPVNWSYDERSRIGDHIWWISDVRRFRSHYPEWQYRYDIEGILAEMLDGISSRKQTVGAL